MFPETVIPHAGGAMLARKRSEPASPWRSAAREVSRGLWKHRARLHLRRCEATWVPYQLGPPEGVCVPQLVTSVSAFDPHSW